METEICIGKRAREILALNLFENANIRLKGYYRDNGIWIAFDNFSGDCWVEEFSKEEQAIAWLCNFFEISMIDEIKIIKIICGIYFIRFEKQFKFFKLDMQDCDATISTIFSRY